MKPWRRVLDLPGVLGVEVLAGAVPVLAAVLL